MDSLFGIQGKDFVIVAADCTAAFSILKFKDDEDKIINLDDDKLMGLSGEAADRIQYGDFMQKNIHLYKYRNSQKLTTRETANFIRTETAQALRKGPYMVNSLVAGYDSEDGASLYWLDYLGTLQRVTKGAHGYAGHFLYGLLNNFNKSDLSLEEGIEIIKYCTNELKTRFLLSQHHFIAKIITREGIRKIDF